MEHSTMLPQDLFTCSSLVVLKLKTYGDMNIVPTSVSLPSLRILHLFAISKALTDLFKGMSNVQFLHLNVLMLDIYMRDCQLPKFPNMTYLELGDVRDVRWKFLPELLENSPRLETLFSKR
ncbi:F-box/LRR-repeat protein At3g59200-like [Rhododendron vialii]|uniref:F-box/LRR-repeat protein At3g59200-like n=1 Tax=Rhododendron vialii TaxID=182163 RepID=UPI00265EE817|nr:F-box/LRR-repeat protein At3g59200-like [Rhododendron vialii]